MTTTAAGGDARTGSRIESIEVIPFSIPLRHVVTFATGRLTHADHLLIRVTTDDGVTGVAEAIPRPMIYGESAPSIRHAIETIIAPAARSLDLLDSEALAHRLRHLAGNPSAKSSVELAIFDALGNRLGVSCHALLGGYTDRVRCTAILGAGAIDEVVDEAVQLTDTYGISSFKVKVGMDLPRDITLMRRLRAALPDGLFYTDANHGFTSAEALAFLRAAADQGLAWIEEPCPADDLLGRADIVAKGPVPVLGDESCTTTREVATEILARRCNMISIKLARTAVRASTRIRDFCELAGAPVLVGSQGDSGIGTHVSVSFAAATPATSANPAELAYFLGMTDDLLVEPPQIVNGVMRVPDGTGFGLSIDPDKLDKFRTDRS